MYEYNNDAYDRDNSPVLGRRAMNAMKTFRSSSQDDIDHYPTRDYSTTPQSTFRQYLPPKRDMRQSSSSIHDNVGGSLSRLKTEEDLSGTGGRDFYHSDPRDYPTGLSQTGAGSQSYQRRDSQATDSNGFEYGQNYHGYQRRSGNMTYLTDDDFPSREVESSHPQSPTYSRESYSYNNQSSHSSNELPDGNQSTLSSRDTRERLDPGGTVSPSGTIPVRYSPRELAAPRDYSNLNGHTPRNDLNRITYTSPIRDSSNLSHNVHSPNPPNLSYRSSGDLSASRNIVNKDTETKPQLSRVNLDVTPLAGSRDNTVQTPTHKQNGIARPIKESSMANLVQSRASGLNLSRVTLYGSKDYGVRNSLLSLGVVSVLSLIVGILGLQLLFQLKASSIVDLSKDLSHTFLDASTFNSSLEVAVALCSLVVMLNLSCLAVCSLQAYFAAKLQKCPQGDERAFKYLKECSGTRFIAITGFFVSIPTLLLAVLLFMMMQFHSTPAIISMVILSVGVIFVVATVSHSIFFWRKEKTKADENIPPYPNKGPNDRTIMSMSELSTLV